MSLGLTSKMVVREAMSSPVVSVSESDDIVQVSNRMREQKVGAVIVVNKDQQPVGIVTERDVVTRVVADGISPSTVEARSVMSSPLKMVEPEMNILEAMTLMDKSNIRRLGVQYKGKLVGVITDRSIIRYVPTIVEIIKEQKEINENNPNIGPSMVGYCDKCETYSTNLRVIDGEFLCEDCRSEG